MPGAGFNMTQRLAVLVTRLGAEWVLYLLLALSVLSVAVMVERGLFYRRVRHRGEAFDRVLWNLLERGDRAGAEALARSSSGVEGAVALDGLAAMDHGPAVAQEAMAAAVARQRARLERGLPVLGTLGNNAPFIGLFGTVLGIIKAFADLASNVTGGAAAVMAGISEALVATAVGLAVALPAVVAFNTFRGKVKDRLRSAEVVCRVILAHAYRKGGESPPDLADGAEAAGGTGTNSGRTR